MHTSEEVLSSNSARLAARALLNSEIRVHGRRDEPLSMDGLIEPGRQSLLLFPFADAIELNAEYVATLPGPVNLILPDSNWRQTRKFLRRETALATIPKVKLPAGPPSEYHLRHQHDEGNLCSLEAIARAIGILESPQAQAELEHVLRIMVERTRWLRGQIRAAECQVAGIPPDAVRILNEVNL